MIPAAPLLRTLGKWTVTLGVLVFVFWHIDTHHIEQSLQTLSWPLTFAALLALNLAQAGAIFRMRYYCLQHNITLSWREHARLLYASLTYNLLIPGGIGGDAYRMYQWSKHHHIPAKLGLRMALSNRASGLCATMLCATACAMALLPWPWTLITGATAIGALTIYFIAVRWIVNESTPMALGALPYSLAIQGCNAAAFALLWLAIGAHTNIIAYILLFFIAAVVGLLPISVGGLGLREFTFLYGSKWLNIWHTPALMPEIGVTLSLSFFALTTLTALLGIAALAVRPELTPRNNP